MWKRLVWELGGRQRPHKLLSKSKILRLDLVVILSELG